MTGGILNIFRIPELRKRIIFTISLLAVYRIGIFVTTPGVDRGVMKQYLDAAQSQGGGFLNLFNFFSGGALEQLSVFALGIMPYITSSIIMQLMTVAVPALERLKKEGDSGNRKITQYTRYGTILISVIQGGMISSYLKGINHNGHSVVNADWSATWGGSGFVLMTILTLTAGTAFLMWLGEQITERGVGNGISLIIFAGIVARLPEAIYSTVMGLKEGTYKPFEMFILVLVMVGVVFAIVFVERAQRRLPVQYAKRVVGNKQYGGQATHLPLKVNTAGVIPPIFASSILMFPATIASMFEAEWLQSFQNALQPGGWQYETLFAAMIIFFAYFYTAVQFNPVDVADNMKKFGGFIPGVRPGRATAEYIDFVLSRITFGGALYFAIVCVCPVMIQKLVSNQVPFYFGGTGLLIVVGVALDTVNQIEGHLIARHYDGFTGPKKRRIRARGTPTGGSPSNTEAANPA